MIFSKPDGNIEFAISTCYCCPPQSDKTGQHLNSTSRWYKINNGEWKRVIIQYSHYRILAEAAISCEEFLQEIEKLENKTID